MQIITIVTGNPGKVRELETLAKGRLKFRMRDLDLTEIQSLDLAAIVRDKAMRAYQTVKAPVIVDDVSAELDFLNGLPGPFIRFFNQRLGANSLWKLANGQPEKVTIRCMAAYYDSKQLIVGEGNVRGALTAPRGSNGFGFDAVVVPEGQKRTMAEMTESEKSRVSHRGHAFRALLQQLEAYPRV